MKKREWCFYPNEKPKLFDKSSWVRLLDNGLDPNTCWTEGDLVSRPVSGPTVAGWGENWNWAHWNTPLHLALAAGDLESAGFLLSHGADINAFNARGYTALLEAIERQKNDTLSFLIAHGADSNMQSECRLVTYWSGDDTRAELYSPGKHAPLHIAISICNVPIVRKLLDSGADPSLSLPGGWTPLDLALLDQQSPTMEAILRHGGRFSETNTFSIDKKTLNKDKNVFEKARKLFFYTESNEPFPPADTRGVYNDTLSRSLISTIFDNTTLGSQSQLLNKSRELVDSFFRELRYSWNLQDAAAAADSFCVGCAAFQREAIPTYDDGESFESSYRELQVTKNDMEKTAESGCPLCRIVMDFLEDTETTEWAKKMQKQRMKYRDLKRQLKALEEESEENHDFSSDSGEDTDQVCLRMPVVGSYYSDMSLQWRGLSFHLTWATLEETVVRRAFHNDSINSHTGSLKAFRVAKYWLDTFRSSASHKICQRADKLNHHPLPTRVIDVGTQEREPRLCLGDGLVMPYCALSYCWGTTKGTLTTTTTNLKKHLNSIPLDSFPKTLREAILAARGLGFQYLWIDAICIVQDDREDWAREAAKMQSVYAGATLTISSTVSKISVDGLFRSRCRRRSSPVPLQVRMVRQGYPSWSWLSNSVPIRHSFLGSVNRGSVTHLAEVLEHGAVSNAALSEVRGRIRLKGNVGRYDVVPGRQHAERNKYNKKEDLDRYSLDGSKDGDFTCWFVDVLEFAAEGPPKIGYPVYPGGRPASTVRLLLQKVPGEKATFRRIGIAMGDLQRCFDVHLREEILII